MGHADAIDAICSRAYNGLIKAKAKQYIDGTGRRFGNVELPPEFWWSTREIDGNWRTGDLATTSPDSPARLQAFGVEFRRSDIELMIPPMPQGANGASLSSTQTRAGSKVTTPTDGDDWITAAEAIAFLPHSARAICRNAKVGLVRARARLLIWGGERRSNADVPPEFWWAEGGEALSQDWGSGDFDTYLNHQTFRVQAFGVEFRRPDIEQLKPALAASPTAPLSPTQRRVGRTVFIGHGGQSLEWLKLEKFLKERLHLNVVEFNSTPAAGVSTTERLNEMLEAAGFAFLVLTGEDEQATGKFNPRLNVIHEAGLFQGKLGFKKAIILKEEGCEDFSNVHGLTDIRFPKGNIDAVSEQVRGVLEREKLMDRAAVTERDSATQHADADAQKLKKDPSSAKR